MEGFLARAEILGRAGHQPPLRQTTDGRFVTNISVYTNYAQNRADENTVEVNDRHTIVVWDRLAELCAQNIRAGTRIYAEGRLTTRHWIDRETGERRCRTEIHATNVIFLAGVQQTNLMPGYCEHIPEELFEGIKIRTEVLQKSARS
jgi:single-strand DNA-binding protein